jgi:hypothetical protein
MQRDVKDVVGLLLRLLDGGEATQAEIEEFGFEAAGELRIALNEATIKLLEFVHDADARDDREADRRMRSTLQDCLDNIVSAWDRQQDAAPAADRS